LAASQAQHIPVGLRPCVDPARRNKVQIGCILRGGAACALESIAATTGRDVFAGTARNSAACDRWMFGSADSRCVPMKRKVLPLNSASTESQALEAGKGPSGVLKMRALANRPDCAFPHLNFVGS